MPNYNKVLLMGNITREIELKQTPSGQAVATIGLAMNRRFRTRDGEDREETTFVDCEAWGQTAETMQRYLGKGRPVFIEGRLKLDQWEDKEGKKQSKLRVVVESFTFVDSRGGGAGGGGGGGGESGGRRTRADGDFAPAGKSARGGEHVPVEEDDIPF